MSNILNIKSKCLKLTLICLIAPLFIFAQNLTGLWTGTFSNDSNSIRKDQSYEIALTEYRGKVYGYSRSEFIVNDTLYYIVKRVKGKIDGDVCEVKDDEILAYNFPGRLDKGVKVSSFFYRNKQDSTWYLGGNWKTNITRKYYAVTGKINLKEEKDLTASKLFPHLQELNLLDDVAFYKEKTKKPEPIVMKQVEPETKQPSTIDNSVALQKNESASTNKIEKPEQAIASTKNSNPTDKKPGPAKQETARVQKTVKEPVQSPQPETVTSISKPEPTIESLTEEDSKIKVVQQPARLPEEKKTFVSSNTMPQQQEDKKTIVTNLPIANKPEKQQEPIVSNPQPDKKLAVTSIPQTTRPDQQAAIVTNNRQPKQPDKNSTVVATPVNNQPKQSNIAVTNTQLTKTEKPKDVSTNTQPASQKVNTVSVSNTNKQPEKPLTGTTSVTAPVLVPEPVAKKEVLALTKDEQELQSLMAGRKSSFAQMVNFKSDSLELALYDNGEIDGDTVSIFMNGEVIMARQGLKATAIKKTIYLTPGKDDEFTLVLFADNLGKYPPNTGLLVVHDGDDVYNVRFSADLQTNAGVVFKRKK